MLPSDLVARTLNDGDVVGLLMSIGAEKRRFYFHVDSAEKPIVLADFSLGSASALASAGTNWQEITDSDGRFHLEPEYEKTAYQFFFGVSPGQAWVYRRYPSNVDINSLLGTRTIGGQVGFISGGQSPYRSPSPLTEMWSLKTLHPSFLGYHPYAEPSSITVRTTFFVMRYDVTFLGVDPSGTAEDERRRIAPDHQRAKASIRSVGGHQLMDRPSWVDQLLRA